SRLRPRFGLRMLLVVVTIFGVWLGVQVHFARHERQAHEAIAPLARMIEYDFQYDGDGEYVSDAELHTPPWLQELVGEEFFRRIHTIRFSPQTTDADLAGVRDRLENLRSLRRIDLAGAREVSDEGLGHLRGLHRLKTLDLRTTSISNAGIAMLADLPNLEELQLGSLGWPPNRSVDDGGLLRVSQMGSLRDLYLWGGSFTDAGLEHLAEMMRLRLLWLQRTRVSDQGVTHLQKLQNLEVLALEQCEITDAGLPVVGSLPRLKRLYMTGTGVSDEGLKYLSDLHELEKLRVTGTQVTPRGLAQLQTLLPMCDAK
ncbi:MAG: hypothetical protein KY475_07935, partial [Planctomycetes bacterium]|nr:hypothetical protein [Planctomycetota bacterium]